MAIVTIVGNWKMNTTPESAGQLAGEIRSRLEGSDALEAVKVVVCPPSTALETVSRTLNTFKIAVGAQNLHPESSGAFTGEISPLMVKELADFVIVGHSERRTRFGETDDFINQKVLASLNAGLKTILCVGESLDQRQGGQANEVVSSQVTAGLAGVTDPSAVLVAYEPVWAIGTGEAATPDTAQEMMALIRSTLESQFGDVADGVPCLYGGSVNADNIESFISEPDINGALVGGASLSADSFSSIVERSARIRSYSEKSRLRSA